VTEMIDRFVGEYRFLSNFYPALVVLDGEEYRTVEHAYQAAKSSDPLTRKVIQVLETPGLARSAGRSRVVVRDLRPDWDEARVPVMLDLVRQKFSDPLLGARLLATDNALLVEGNAHGDTFWGSVNGKGKNMLGVVLHIVRDELQRRV